MEHYDVVGLFGVGGVGEVYRAHDSKLKRDAALKILPSQFVRDSSRLALFERKAQVLATLNHPNIAAIYGVQKEKGRSALVLELIDGETLAEPTVGRNAKIFPSTLRVSLYWTRQIEK